MAENKSQQFPKSIAEEYFHQFTGKNAYDVLIALPQSTGRVFEGNWMDFKAGGKLQEKEIPRLWSKALGAFANVDGGVVIWGIDARNVGGVDAVQKTDEVADLNKLVTTLNDLYPVATDPPLPKVDIRPIHKPGKTNGFVVCFIPKGAQPPYQSLRGDQPYYMRIGNSSKPMPRTLLSQLFNPKPIYGMQVTMKENPFPFYGKTQVGFTQPNEDHTRDSVCLALKNTGHYSVQDPFVRIECADCILWELVYNKNEHKHETEHLEGTNRWGLTYHPEVEKEKYILVSSATPRLELEWKIIVYGKDMLPLKAEFSYSKAALGYPRKEIVVSLV